MKPLLLPFVVATLACAGAVVTAHAGSPPPASQSARGLHDIPDPELNTLRGRYTIGSNAVAWFGVTMVSTWSTATGQSLHGALAINMDFDGHGQPHVSFLPSVSITRADAALPMPASTATRHVDGSGLANVGGVLQSVQVAGDGNLAGNSVRLNVRDGGAPAATAGAAPGSAADRQDDASASAGFDGRGAGVKLDVNGLGSVQQWIRNGSVGQSVQLAADNQSASNLMEIDLVRQSLAGNAQLTQNLSQNVAQAIALARGIGNP